MRGSRAAAAFHRAVLRWRGWDPGPALAELEALQWAPLAQVREVQAAKLRRLLADCWEGSPWYRGRLEEAGLDPARIARVEGAEDLRGLPVVDKTTLRAHYGEMTIAGGPPSEVWTSSGSTGMPFAFRLDRRAIRATTFAAGERAWRWWGQRPGVRQAMIWSGVRDVSGSAAGRLRALRRRVSWRLKNIELVDVYHLELEATRAAYAKLSRFRPVVMRCIASGLFRFCAGLETLGLEGRRLGVELAIYTGEGLSSAQRRTIERVLGCRVASEYGCTELGIIAHECPEGGMHLTHECMLFEFRKDGRPARAGEEAELIVTALEERAAPLLRYAVGDVVVPGDEPCPCGRTMPVILSLAGRSEDVVRTPDGREIHFLFFTHLFDDLSWVHQFRVVQEALDQLRIEIRSPSRLEEADRSLLRDRVLRKLGSDVEVAVEQVAELPVSAGGKHRWVVSRLDPA